MVLSCEYINPANDCKCKKITCILLNCVFDTLLHYIKLMKIPQDCKSCGAVKTYSLFSMLNFIISYDNENR